MKTMQEIATQDVIVEDLDKQYDSIIEALQNAKNNQQPIEEGILGAIGGAIAGATILPKIMGALCDALGIDKRGQLGSLLTSRLIMTIVGGKVGLRL
jgi:hypothetical protein